MNIKIIMRDGTVKDFPHVGRNGGSYTKEIEYKSAMTIVIDEWGKRTAIPNDLIAEVQTTPHRPSW